MSKPLSAYETTRTGADTPKDITATPKTGDKWALDTCIKNGVSEPVPVSIVSGSAGTNTQTIYNETIAAADTEQSLALPTNIVGYMIKSRGGGEIKLSHVAAQSGTLYLTVKGRAVYTDEHNYTGLTLYFQSPTAGEVVEIVAWE